MLKKVLIADVWFEGNVSEYFVFLSEKSTDEDFCNVAWEYALDSFAVDPNRKSNYKFEIHDYVTY